MFQKNYNILSTWILLLLLFPSTLLVAQTEIKDADNDTKVETERTADDDIIRFRSGGIDRLRMVGARIEPLSNGNSIFLGSRAGENDDLSNNRNAFIGFQAGLENINGAFNSAIGFAALQSNVNGSLNTAIGLSALRNHTNSTSNLAIGYNTGAVLTAGNFNSFIGARAGSAITSGNANTFIGNEAGRNVTSGDANTYIGSYAGRNAGTGSRNVFIGNLAGENETGSDKLYIANSNTSTPLIGGDFANKKVGINTSNPNYTLDVQSTEGNTVNLNSTTADNFISFQTSGGNFQGYAGVFTGDNDMEFGTGGTNTSGKTHLVTQATPRLTVAADGNVGIGTQFPFYKLEVNNGLIRGYNTSDRTFWFTRFNNGSIGLLQGSGTANSAYLDYNVASTTGDEGRVGALAVNTMGIAANGKGEVSFSTDAIKRMVIDSVGRIGINDPAPADRLVVKDSVVTTTGGVIHATYTKVGNLDRTAIKGTSTPAPGYGYGVEGTGGFIGVKGNITSTGSIYNTIAGHFQNVSIGAAGTSNIGVYGEAAGSDTNWAGYFLTGNVFVQNDLRVGSLTGKTGYKVSIDGKVVAEEMLIQDSGDWPDYVFTSDYDLAPLSEVKAHIADKGHLPGVPSAAEVAETGGAMVGQMQRVLLEKVEELTLHLISAEERATAAEARLAKLEALILDQQD